jgi:hypothetical protein
MDPKVDIHLRQQGITGMGINLAMDRKDSIWMGGIGGRHLGVWRGCWQVWRVVVVWICYFSDFKKVDWGLGALGFLEGLIFGSDLIGILLSGCYLSFIFIFISF